MNPSTLPSHSVGHMSVNEDTWEVHIDSILDFLRAFSLKLTRNPEDAHDLLQETLYRAWRSRDLYKPGNFKGWACTIMKNIFLTEMRRKSSQERNHSRSELSIAYHNNQRMFVGGVQGGEPRVYSSLDLKQVIEKIHQLPELYREVMVLVVEDKKYAEIANVLNISLGAVKSRIFYGREKLRTLIEE